MSKAWGRRAGALGLAGVLTAAGARGVRGAPASAVFADWLSIAPAAAQRGGPTTAGTGG